MKYAMVEPWMNSLTSGLELSHVLKPEHRTEKTITWMLVDSFKEIST